MAVRKKRTGTWKNASKKSSENHGKLAKNWAKSLKKTQRHEKRFRGRSPRPPFRQKVRFWWIFGTNVEPSWHQNLVKKRQKVEKNRYQL